MILTPKSGVFDPKITPEDPVLEVFGTHSGVFGTLFRVLGVLFWGMGVWLYGVYEEGGILYGVYDGTYGVVLPYVRYYRTYHTRYPIYPSDIGYGKYGATVSAFGGCIIKGDGYLQFNFLHYNHPNLILLPSYPSPLIKIRQSLTVASKKEGAQMVHLNPRVMFCTTKSYVMQVPTIIEAIDTFR